MESQPREEERKIGARHGMLAHRQCSNCSPPEKGYETAKKDESSKFPYATADLALKAWKIERFCCRQPAP
jgi:hypothetical protein